MNTREVVFEILLELEQQPETHLNELLRQVLDKYDYLEGRDRAFIKRLAQGTVERRIQIDYILDHFSSLPVRKMKRPVRNLLRMGVYQILWMDHVPDSAACNETVALAGKKHLGNLKKFINGILRNVSRGKDSILEGGFEWPDRDQDPIAYLSVTCSMPEELTSYLAQSYGVPFTQRVLESFLQDPGLSVRLSKGLSEEAIAELETSWRRDGIVVSTHPYLSDARILRGVPGAAKLCGFDSGAFQVQDVSSMLIGYTAGLLLEKLEGDDLLALDVCAAPGGKTIHLAQLLGSRGQVISCDLSEYKTDKILENLERTGILNVTVLERDATVFDPELEEKADLLLADVPCSGLGVIGKKPDIRDHISVSSMNRLVELQKAIVSNVSRYVKKGGYLIYSTCTLAPDENIRMTKWITEEVELTPVSLASLGKATPYEKIREEIETAAAKAGIDVLGEAIPGRESNSLQILPGINSCDGFFLAVFQKV